jgi:hypothetical protein
MAELVRAAYELPTLRIRLDRTTSVGAAAVFELIHGPDVQPVCSVDTKALGLPDEVTSPRDVPEQKFTIPAPAAEQIVNALGPLDQMPELWLELPFPRGYLHLVPWEALLSKEIGRPLRRLPNFTLRPHAPGDTLRVLLCTSAPAAKSPFPARELLEQVVGCWTSGMSRRVTVHIFGDAQVAQAARSAFGQRPDVTVHDPSEAAAFPAPTRMRTLDEAPDEITSPWLLWMESALGGVAADVVHFVGHGYLSCDQGAVALASSPMLNTDTTMARFIGGTQLAGFMGRVGAWTLGLTGPAHNYCGAGLRALADGIALVRPGIAIVHDAGIDRKMGELHAALRMIYEAENPRVPLASVCSWSHPAAVEFNDEPAAELLTADGESALFAESTQTVLAAEETPAWVAAGARALEGLQADWFSDKAMPRDQEAIDALRKVTDLFDEHVRAHMSDPGVGPT